METNQANLIHRCPYSPGHEKSRARAFVLNEHSICHLLVVDILTYPRPVTSETSKFLYYDFIS